MQQAQDFGQHKRRRDGPHEWRADGLAGEKGDAAAVER